MEVSGILFTYPYFYNKRTPRVGGLVEVAWTVRTNHGGGYQYRLCPAGSKLTEDCFHKMPLPFEGLSSLRWGGKTAGKQLWFKGTYVSEGTLPEGSTWAMNPLPRVDATKFPDATDGFPAPCYDPAAPKDGGYGGLCSGWYGPRRTGPHTAPTAHILTHRPLLVLLLLL